MPDFRPGLREGVGLYQRIDPYPLARTDRSQPITTNSSVPATVNVPRVFLWAGHLRNAGANTHAIITSRRVRGPAYLDEFNGAFSLGAGAGNSPKFILGWSPSDVPEGNDLLDAALLQVTTIFEQDFRDDGGFTAAGRDGIYSTPQIAIVRGTVRLGYAIQAPEFHLVAAVRTAGDAGAYIVDFTMRTLENVEPEILADLMASA